MLRSCGAHVGRNLTQHCVLGFHAGGLSDRKTGEGRLVRNSVLTKSSALRP